MPVPNLISNHLTPFLLNNRHPFFLQNFTFMQDKHFYFVVSSPFFHKIQHGKKTNLKLKFHIEIFQHVLGYFTRNWILKVFVQSNPGFMFYEKNDYIFLPNTTNIIEIYFNMCYEIWTSNFTEYMQFHNICTINIE